MHSFLSYVNIVSEKIIIGEFQYQKVSRYDTAELNQRIGLEGIIDSKPVIKHTPSSRLFKIQAVNYYVNTTFTVDTVKVFYEGPAFLRKGQYVTLWGKKKHDHFEVIRIETEDFILEID